VGVYNRVLKLALADADVAAVCASQSNSGAVKLLINGTDATGGVATLDAARQILFTFAGDEHLHTYVVTGTDVNGTSHSETVTGTNGTTATTVGHYTTVTSILASASSTSTIQVGTNGVAVSPVMVVDRFISATNITAAVVVTGTANYSIQVAYADLAPDWNLVTGAPTWFAPPNTVNLTSQTTAKSDVITMPITMIRLLQNSFSSGGTIAATINIPMRFV
jgi:hypothetical protein